MDKEFVSVSDVANVEGNKVIDFAWDDFTSDGYCTEKCMMLEKCSADREHCVKKILANVFHTLTETEETVLRLRCGFYGGKHFSLAEVEECLGITGEQARRIEAKVLRKLRHPARSKQMFHAASNCGNFTTVEEFIAEIYNHRNCE